MKKLKFIDKVRVENPCKEEWEQMVGDDKVRFCSHCAKHVNNFAEMRRKEAIRLVRKNEGRLCIRYITDPITDAPIFADDLVRISRRASKVAASVMTASLSLATLSYAQGGASTRSPNVVPRADETIASEKSDGEHEKKPMAGTMSSISGTVSDPQGAAVPRAEIELLDAEDNELSHTTSNDDGFYIFERVPIGSYTIRMMAPGFRVNRINTTVEDEKIKTVDGTLAIGAIGGAIVVVSEFKGDLAKAVSRDDIDGARNLIAAGADVNGREEDRSTPLSIAVDNGNLEIVRMLLDFGANVNAGNKDKETPLMRLDEDASKEIVEALVVAGANVNDVSDNGNTPLILAAEDAKSEVVQALIDAGAGVNVQNKNGETPLMKAAEGDDIDSVRALVLAGAFVNLKDNDGETAWDKTSDHEIEEFLVAHGAIVEDEPDQPNELDGGGRLTIIAQR